MNADMIIVSGILLLILACFITEWIRYDLAARTDPDAEYPPVKQSRPAHRNQGLPPVTLAAARTS